MTLSQQKIGAWRSVMRAITSAAAIALGAAAASAPSVATAAPAAGAASMTLADCYDVEGPARTGEQLGGSLSPAETVNQFWYAKFGKELSLSMIDAKVSVVEGPKHGTLMAGGRDDLGPAFLYTPTAGYLGQDTITFLVEVAGKRVKVVTTMYVVEQVDGYGRPPCGYDIKRISAAESDAGRYSVAGLQQPEALSRFLAAASGVTLSFGDLAGVAVAQTAGSSSEATITLDTDAAGHGWYLDSTPLSNDDAFLPTADPNVWKASTDAVLMAQASEPGSARSQMMPAVTLVEPWIVPSDPQYAYAPGRFAAVPAIDACGELLQFQNFKFLHWTSPTCKLIEIVKKPKHGVLVDEGNGAYGFKPEPGYLGKDSFQYIVEGEDGRRVLVTMPILMKTMAEAFSFYQLIPLEKNNTLAMCQKQSEISALLVSAASVVYRASDLAGSAVANTVGDASSAQITLDTDAAGHGWYLDPTPLDNSDAFLPTADPNVWKARPGSAADGHIDMLSVLLHEYGHVLGLEHSADVRDFMAATRPDRHGR